MSWIFGCFSENIDESTAKIFESIHTMPIQLFKTTSLYLAVGGNKNAAFTSKDLDQVVDESKSWVVSGVGLITDGQNQKIMSSTDWSKLLETDNFNVEKLNGHFVVVIWGNDRSVKIYNDIIGLRTIYVSHQKNQIIFSTELAWVTKNLNFPKINLEVLGSRWLTFNQLSHSCLINGVERLSAGGKIEIKNSRINNEKGNWIPKITDATEESFSNGVGSFLFPQSKLDYPITLGLSGGLDSRTLLALAFRNTSKKLNENFQIHSFGDKSDPDYLIAAEISKKIGIEHTLLSTNITYDEDFIRKLSNYSSNALLVEPVSAFLKNIYFDDQYFLDKIVIDGANGEIARRQFYNRLFLKGKNDLEKRNVNNIFKHLRVNRADVFIPEVTTEMENGCLRDIENIFEVLPAIEEVGSEKFVDLLAIKYRFPNYFGPEQSRLDKKIISYMPYSQVPVLEQAFYLPSTLKRNSKLFYKLIDKHKPVLKNFPLVKNGITYPYGMNSISAFIYTKLKRRITHQPTLNEAYSFYQSMKEYVNELILNSEVQNFPLYNHQKIIMIADNYYKGDTSMQSQLDWWLTFELWRRNLNLT